MSKDGKVCVWLGGRPLPWVGFGGELLCSESRKLGRGGLPALWGKAQVPGERAEVALGREER